MEVGPITAREHQVNMFLNARTAISEMIQRGIDPRLCMVAPTGAGKTIVTSMIMHAMKEGKRVAFLVSGRQLVIQKSRTLSMCEIRHSVMMADIYGEIRDRKDEGDIYCREYNMIEPDDHLEKIVISKDTLEAREVSLSDLGIDLVIVDECHQSLSQNWQDMLREAGCPVIGVTATPIDGKGQGLPFYNKTIVGATYSELIEKELLVPCKVLIPFVVEMRRKNGKKVQVTNGEYVQSQVDEIFNEKALIGDVVSTWQELADNRPTLVYASSVAHAIALSEEFQNRGITAEYVDAETSTKDREDKYKRFQNGKLKVLTNYGVLRVGVDFPCAEVIQLAVSMNSLSQFMQTVGRGLRPYHNKETGYKKTHCTLIDHGGNVLDHKGQIKHGWPTDDRAWPDGEGDKVRRIDKKTGKPTDEEPRVSVCPKCKFEKGGKKICPNCGYEYTRPGITVRTPDAQFKEVTEEEVKKKKKKESSDDQKIWCSCLGIAAAKDGPVGMAMALFRRKTNRPVPRNVSPQPESHQLKMKVRAVYPGFYRRKKETA